MARHVEPEIDRHGRYQRLTRPPCDIGKTRAHVTRCKLAGRRSPADWDAWQAPTSQRRGEAMVPIFIDRGAPAPPDDGPRRLQHLAQSDKFPLLQLPVPGKDPGRALHRVAERRIEGDAADLPAMIALPDEAPVRPPAELLLDPVQGADQRIVAGKSLSLWSSGLRFSMHQVPLPRPNPTISTPASRQAASAGRTRLAISVPCSRSITAMSYWLCRSSQNCARFPK